MMNIGLLRGEMRLEQAAGSGRWAPSRSISFGSADWKIVFPDTRADIHNADFWEQTVSQILAEHDRVPQKRLATLRPASDGLVWSATRFRQQSSVHFSS